MIVDCLTRFADRRAASHHVLLPVRPHDLLAEGFSREHLVGDIVGLPAILRVFDHHLRPLGHDDVLVGE
ncbi:hypothetical protein D3C77_652430 [compost metagenome]